jgi:serine/threonine protein phosphatase 1
MVLKRLFGKPEPLPPRNWRAPDGLRIYAIGDIHGCRRELDILIAKIEADNAARPPARTQIIFLGDLADRGPDSRGVIERLMQLAEARDNVRFIFGNHEELLILAWEGNKRALGLFNRVGGRETMHSYGVSDDIYDAATLDDLGEIVASYIPAAHIEFLRGFEDWIVAGDYLFVHAGVRPGASIEEQEASDLRWIRREFTEHRGDFGHMVIHGHTITEAVDAQPNRIGIDTGAFATGRLTAIGIEGEDRWFLSTRDPL